MAGNTPPAGGTPREWLTRGSGSQELVNSIDHWADHYSIPRQFVYDLVWRENGIGAGTGNERLRITTSDAGAAGPMQLVPAARRYYGINANSSTDDMVFAGVSMLFENGTNTGYGRLSNVNGGRAFDQWNPAAAAGMYIAGPDYYRWLNGETGTSFGPTSQSYVIETTRNTVPLDQLPERFRGLPITQFYGEPHGSGDLGVSPSFDLGVSFNTGNVGGDPALLNWHGDTGQEIGTPNEGLNTPLPYAGTGLQGQSLQDWIASPTGGQQVAGLSAQSGYTLTPDVVEFVGRTAPELGRGPEGFSEGNFPWFTPGRISEDVGEVLQHHALMPNNLVFNPNSLTWDVPQEKRFPSNVGIWGAQRVADWLPTSSPGFEHDYLKHLGYGAPPAGNLFANPYGGPTFGMGNQGFGNIADMSTYGHQPFDYTQWFNTFGGGGGGGNPGNLGSGFDMGLYNQTAGIGGTGGGGGGGASGDIGGGYQPDYNYAHNPSIYGGGGITAPIDYHHYFATMGLPSGGFDQPAESERGPFAGGNTIPTPPGGYGYITPLPITQPMPFQSGGLNISGIPVAPGLVPFM